MRASDSEVSEAISLAAAVMDEECEAPPGFLGGQMSVWAQGVEVATFSKGNSAPGTPMLNSQIHNVWCAAKPILTTAALHFLWSRSLLDSPLATYLAPQLNALIPAYVGIMTLPEVLSNSAGLASPSLFDAMLKPAAISADSLRLNMETCSRTPTVGTFVPGKIAQWAVESVSGAPVATVVRPWLTKYLLYADEILFDFKVDSDLHLEGSRIGPYRVMRSGDPFWAYHDRTAAVAGSESLATGGYCSMRALAEFYNLLVHENSPLDSRFVRAILDRPATRAFDAGLNMMVDCVPCFLTGLPGVPADDRRYICQPGFGGCSIGLGLPGAEISVAIFVNGLFSSSIDVDFFRSRVLAPFFRINK